MPKPLVPVGDRPLLAHIVEDLRSGGIDELVVNTHHLADEFDKFIEQLAPKIHVIHEPLIRGTAGGIAGARSLLRGPVVLVWNGDILTRPPMTELLDRGAASGGVVFAAAAQPMGEGTLGLDDAGRVVRLRGECFGVETMSADYVGVAALGAEALAALPDRGCLIADFALPLLRKGGVIETVRSFADWHDVGGVTGYWQANLAWLEGRGAAGWLARGAHLDPDVELVGSVVGAGARVEGSGSLTRCVVWPGARVTAPLADTIVTRRALVRGDPK
jgi:mannose-1-phosphate guanylyltransferase